MVYRILKPGGRFAISDIALKKTLPAEVEREVAAWTGCIGGALSIEENQSALRRAGFFEIAIKDSKADLNVYKEGGNAVCCGPKLSCCDPTSDSPGKESVDFHKSMSDLLDAFDVNEYAASVKIFALKPEV